MEKSTILFLIDSYRHKRLIKSDAILETFRGNSMASIPFKMMLYVFIGSEPENGALNYRFHSSSTNEREKSTNFPSINSNINTPNDQQSAAMSWPLFKMISGATYSELIHVHLEFFLKKKTKKVPGVPQKVHVFFPSPTFFAKPKSTWNEKWRWD